MAEKSRRFEIKETVNAKAKWRFVNCRWRLSIIFIQGTANGGKTYEELAAEYHVSTSVVKKDMAAACRLFGVTNKEDLRILLLQYKIE